MRACVLVFRVRGPKVATDTHTHTERRDAQITFISPDAGLETGPHSMCESTQQVAGQCSPLEGHAFRKYGWNEPNRDKDDLLNHKCLAQVQDV